MHGDSSLKIRVFSFLNQLYPFLFFEETDLKRLSENVRISVFKKDKVVFSIGQQPGGYFYVIKKGAVRIEQVENGLGLLVDLCGEGELFGLRSIIAESMYLYNAIALEDTILYEVPAKLFIETYNNYPQASAFILKQITLNQIHRDKSELKNAPKSLLSEYSPIIRNSEEKKLVVAGQEDSIQSAIEKMSQHNVSSIIVVNLKTFPVGIITDRDIRNYVAKGYDGLKPLDSIMSSPVTCITPQATMAEIQLTMIDSGFHHLCVTEDGSNLSKCIDIVTEHDLLYAGANDPVVIIKQIKSAATISGLKKARTKIDRFVKLLVHGESQGHKTMLTIADHLNRAVIKKAAEISFLEESENNKTISKSHFAFFTMGSAARGEQLLITDQDNGLIIHEDHLLHKNSYENLGKRICNYLNEIGYLYCPADMMARNPYWCVSLNEYKKRIRHWVMSPGPEEILNTSIFFDFRHELGNKELTRNLTSFILETIKGQDVFFRFLASQATGNPPPTSFFRNFIVEKDGAHKDLFDVKLRAISPLVDSARLLALNKGFMISGSTIARFEFLKKADESNEVLYNEAIESFLELLITRVENWNQEMGRYINPADLDKVKRLKLRQCFEPIKRLQNMIERMFQIAYLR